MVTASVIDSVPPAAADAVSAVEPDRAAEAGEVDRVGAGVGIGEIDRLAQAQSLITRRADGRAGIISSTSVVTTNVVMIIPRCAREAARNRRGLPKRNSLPRKHS